MLARCLNIVITWSDAGQMKVYDNLWQFKCLTGLSASTVTWGEITPCWTKDEKHIKAVMKTTTVILKFKLSPKKRKKFCALYLRVYIERTRKAAQCVHRKWRTSVVILIFMLKSWMFCCFVLLSLALPCLLCVLRQVSTQCCVGHCHCVCVSVSTYNMTKR